MRKKCEVVGISDRYRLILLFLGRNDGSTQLDIVNWTKLKAPTISLTLQMMEEDGLIKSAKARESSNRAIYDNYKEKYYKRAFLKFKKDAKYEKNHRNYIILVVFCGSHFICCDFGDSSGGKNSNTVGA